MGILNELTQTFEKILYGHTAEQGDAYAAEARRQYERSTDIQNRVADAKAAGIHPLYALGASVHSGTPIVPESTGGSGPGVAEAALQSQQFNRDADRADAEAGARIARDHAQAALFSSQAALAQQSLNQHKDDEYILGYGPGPNGTEIPLYGKVEVLESKMPARKVIRLPGGGEFVIRPSDDAQTIQNEFGDVLESVYGGYRLLDSLGRYGNVLPKYWTDQFLWGKGRPPWDQYGSTK